MSALVPLAAAAFGLAAFAGVHAGDALAAGRVAHADGPVPVAFARWPFPLAGAAIGIALALHGVAPARLGVLALVVLALAGCTAADLACGMLPDLLTLGALALTLGASLVAHDVAPVAGALIVGLPFALTAALSRGRGMGWGDVKLAALGGALLGARDATLACLLAGIAAYLMTRRADRAGTPVAFGPYLAGSIAVTLAAIA